MQLTLLQRRGSVAAEEFAAALNESLSDLKGELSASARLVGFSKNGWAKVAIDGADSEILSEIITREFGQAQVDIAHLELHANHMAIVKAVGTDLQVDIGIEEPSPLGVNLGVRTLRAQLCDGRNLPCKEITECYCIQPGSALLVRIEHLERDTGRIEAWVADSQIELFSDWVASRLERIQVFDCTRRRVDLAIRRANLDRDVISVESSTLTTHSAVCKLGTDAIGLIPKLGGILRKSELKPFLPKRVLAKCRQW